MDDELKAILALYKASKEKQTERWDHSGFNTLYPNGVGTEATSKPPIDGPQIPIDVDKLDRWDHSGFNLLYNIRTTKKKSKKSSHKKSR